MKHKHFITDDQEAANEAARDLVEATNCVFSVCRWGIDRFIVVPSSMYPRLCWRAISIFTRNHEYHNVLNK